MQVTIESINQKMELVTDKGAIQVRTSINIRLPNGTSIAVDVEPQVAQEIVQASALKEVEPKQPGPSYTEEVEAAEPTETNVFFEEQDPDAMMVDWTGLPDDSISPQIKKVLANIGAPRAMKISELSHLVDKISEQFLKQAEQKSKPVGKVHRVDVPRAKTVPKDEYGYPVVAQKASEAESSSSDEDGVPQL